MVISVCLPEAGCKFAFFCHAVFQDWAPDHSIDISLKFSLNSFLITSMLQIMDKDRQLTCELPLWMFTPLLAVIHDRIEKGCIAVPAYKDSLAETKGALHSHPGTHQLCFCLTPRPDVSSFGMGTPWRSLRARWSGEKEGPSQWLQWGVTFSQVVRLIGLWLVLASQE
eukprot:1149137-Pelagomonas_calceolata.AAC.5